MALDTGVAGRDVVHVGRIENIAATRMRYVFTARPMAAFAAYVPLGDLLGVNVVSD